MSTKSFDAVQLMRELRDNLSEAMGPMTPEQRIQFIREKGAQVPVRARKASSADIPAEDVRERH